MHLIKMQWQNQQQVQLQLEERLRRNPVCFSIEKVGDEKNPKTGQQDGKTPRMKSVASDEYGTCN